MFSGSSLQGALKLAARPSQTISKKGEEFELNAKGSLLYLQKCTDCHAKIVEKATKVVLEDCHNLVVDVKSPLLSGTLEIISSKNIVLNLLEDGKIPTITADSTSELTINMLQHSQFGTLYLHQSSDIEVGILGDNPVKHKVCFPADDPLHFQFVVHWEKQNDVQVIVCEKVVREGVYPTTERKLKEDTERRQRNMMKMAEALADCITVARKPTAKPKDKPSDKVPSGATTNPPTEPSKAPGRRKPVTQPNPDRPRDHHNIENEDEKNEFFDSPGELEKKIDLLAKWVKESKHCIVFTGAGVSTSTGIPDFRSGMNTVLKTGPGVWELQAKGASRKPGAAIRNMLKAIPSSAHMAIVQLHKEGLVKFTVSQNVDGLHLRSGIPSSELAELHGNSNLEKCTVCGAKYLRDYDTCSTRGRDHRTGRSCDNPKCRGQLIDSIIHFGENLPSYELEKSYKEGRKTDLIIVLGSSLRVTPAADIPACAIRRRQKLVICNLQKTPLTAQCSLQLYSEIDKVMKGLMDRLGFEIPPFVVKRRFFIDTTSDKLLVQGLDLECDTPYSFFKQVSVRVSTNHKGKIKVVKEKILTKEPLEVHFQGGLTITEANSLHLDIELGFHGHYGEPNLSFSETLKFPGKNVYCGEYDLNKGKWSLRKYGTS